MEERKKKEKERQKEVKTERQVVLLRVDSVVVL
jgi:hypothetical protein